MAITEVKSLNMSLLKVTKNSGHFPREEAHVQIDLPRTEKQRKKMDHVIQGLEISFESVQHNF